MYGMIQPHDLQKGDKVQLKNGWNAIVKGKAKGIRILLEVHGYSRDLGEVYTRELAWRLDDAGNIAARIVVLNPKHKQQFRQIELLGF